MAEQFDCAPGLRLEAHEKLTALHMKTLDERLRRIETAMERLEKKLWLTVYGVVAVILAQAIESLVIANPVIGQ